LDIGLPLAGVVIILSAILFLQEIRSQISVVLIGIILIESGIWKISNRILPDDRKFFYLRSEIDTFIILYRQLNSAAVKLNNNNSAENEKVFNNIRDDLENCLERIVETAEKTKKDAVTLTEYAQSLN
jgi:hypothetical protein